MTNTVTALSNVVTGSALWGEIAPAMPFLGAMILFAFSYYVFRRIVRKAPKGKTGI